MESKHPAPRHWISLALVLFPVLFWGLSFISTKVVLREMGPVSIAFFRQLIALAPLAIWGLMTKASFKIAPWDLVPLSVSSFFGIVLYFVFENHGLVRTTASNASMIAAAVPVFTYIAEAIFFKAKMGNKTLFCILVSIVGVYLVISIDGKLDFSSATFQGNMLVFAAMLSWVFYTLIIRDLARRYTSFQIVFYQMLLSGALFIPFVLSEAADWRPLTWVSLLNLVYLGVFCSAISYLSFLLAIQRLGPTVSSAFLNLIPVVSVIAGYLVLGERLAMLQFAGMGLILASLFYLGKKQPQ
jgi:drug/metabolite transporter (DMT)-like permease